jgi:opacity protein-like surface antigen
MSYSRGAFVAGLWSLVLCQSVHAEGPLAASTAPGAPATDWSGLYTGFALATPRDGNFWRRASDGLELVPGAWQGSAMVMSVGRDWQRGSLTYGAALAYGDGIYSANPGDAAFINCAECETAVSEIVTLTGRLGFVAGQTRFFATGGLARADVLATNLFGLLTYADTSMTGWTLGVGVEQRIADGFSVVLAYDRVDLGTLALPDYLPTGETQVNVDRVQVGMNVRW